MTACSEKLQFVGYVTESAWAENSTDMTGAQRVPSTALFNLEGIRQSIIASERVRMSSRTESYVTPAWTTPMSTRYAFSWVRVA